MKSILKKALAIVLVFACAFTLFAMPATADVGLPEPPPATGGSVSANATWAINVSPGVLEINGSGAVPAYAENGQPWNEFKPYITELVIGEGITSIGALAFAGCTSLTSATFPASLSSMEQTALSGANNLSVMIFAGETAPSIMPDGSFQNLPATGTIYSPITGTGYAALGGLTSWTFLSNTSANINDLADLVAEANALIKSETAIGTGNGNGQYPQSALDALIVAKNAASAKLGNVTLPQAEINNAVAALKKAIQTFKAAKVAVNFTDANYTLTQARKVANQGFTTSSWNAFRSAIDVLANTIAKAHPTQAETNSATSAVKYAATKLQWINGAYYYTGNGWWNNDPGYYYPGYPGYSGNGWVWSSEPGWYQDANGEWYYSNSGGWRYDGNYYYPGYAGDGWQWSSEPGWYQDANGEWYYSNSGGWKYNGSYYYPGYTGDGWVWSADPGWYQDANGEWYYSNSGGWRYNGSYQSPPSGSQSYGGVTITTPAGKPMSVSSSGALLPGGGTLTLPGSAITVTAPANTSVINSGLIIFPESGTATIKTSGGITITVYGYADVTPKGVINVSPSSRAQVKYPNVSNTTAVVGGSSIEITNAHSSQTSGIKISSSVTSSPAPAPAPKPIDPNSPFVDVRPSAWYYNDVMFMYANGLINGVSETRFDPDGALTRSMVVVMLARAAGANLSQYSTRSFSDVDPSSYAASAIEWAHANGIVNGVGNGRFAPSDKITRQDLAVLLLRYVRFTNKDFAADLRQTVFSDSAEISSYAAEAIQIFYNAGIISGIGGDKIDPKGTASRAQAAVIIHRYAVL
jgi:hypothetical protein